MLSLIVRVFLTPLPVTWQSEGKDLTKEEKQRLRKEKKQQKKIKEKKDDKASQENEKEKKPVTSAAPASQPPTQPTVQKGASHLGSSKCCCIWVHSVIHSLS